MQKIYIIKCQDCYKVGVTNDPVKRMKGLQVGNPYELEIVSTYTTLKPKQTESLIHHELKWCHVRGEWFNGELDDIKKAIIKVLDGISDSVGEEIKVDANMLSRYMTGGAGMPGWKASILGVKLPLKRGWKKKIIGRVISKDTHRLLMKRQKV